MTTHNGSKSNSYTLPLLSVNLNTKKINFVLPFFDVINMTISCGVTIYRAYKNSDIPMIVFITFVYFGAFLLDYWFRLYHKLPPSDQSSKKLKLKIGIWVLFSSIMLGFAYEFSTFLSFNESLYFFGVVISGNTFLFYVYFIREGDKSDASTCLITNGGESREAHDSCYNEKELQPLTEGVDNV